MIESESRLKTPEQAVEASDQFTILIQRIFDRLDIEGDLSELEIEGIGPVTIDKSESVVRLYELGEERWSAIEFKFYVDENGIVIRQNWLHHKVKLTSNGLKFKKCIGESTVDADGVRQLDDLLDEAKLRTPTEVAASIT